jgi:hypothetical protein
MIDFKCLVGKPLRCPPQYELPWNFKWSSTTGTDHDCYMVLILLLDPPISEWLWLSHRGMWFPSHDEGIWPSSWFLQCLWMKNPFVLCHCWWLACGTTNAVELLRRPSCWSSLWSTLGQKVQTNSQTWLGNWKDAQESILVGAGIIPCLSANHSCKLMMLVLVGDWSTLHPTEIGLVLPCG